MMKNTLDSLVLHGTEKSHKSEQNKNPFQMEDTNQNVCLRRCASAPLCRWLAHTRLTQDNIIQRDCDEDPQWSMPPSACTTPQIVAQEHGWFKEAVQLTKSDLVSLFSKVMWLAMLCILLGWDDISD